MPRVTQLSAWVENRPGRLGRLADALGEKEQQMTDTGEKKNQDMVAEVYHYS